MGDWVIDTLKDPRIAKCGVDASIARAPVRSALLCPRTVVQGVRVEVRAWRIRSTKHQIQQV